MAGMRITIEYLCLGFLVCMAMSLVCVDGQICTDTLVGRKVEEMTKREPCIQKFTARCSWLSLSYCTFNRSTFCEKKVNETVTYHYIHTGCCAGYYMAQNKTCLKRIAGKDYTQIEVVPLPPPDEEDPNATNVKPTIQRGDEESKLSVGAYAGIICGFSFICVLAVFIGLAVRKKQKRLAQKSPTAPKSPSPSAKLMAENAEQMQTLKPPEEKTGSSVSGATGAAIDDAEEGLVLNLPDPDPDRTTIV